MAENGNGTGPEPRTADTRMRTGTNLAELPDLWRRMADLTGSQAAAAGVAICARQLEAALEARLIGAKDLTTLGGSRRREFSVEQLHGILADALGRDPEQLATHWRVGPDGEFLGVVVIE